jgi:integral membrane protein
MTDLAIDRDTVRSRLDFIRIVAIVDGILLLVLIWAAVTDSEGVVDVLGPIHGIGYLILLFLCIRGAAERMWGWWFPALVVVTLGPPGSLIGDIRIRRTLT